MATITVSSFDKPIQVVTPVDASGNPLGGTGTSSDQVQGNVASGATDAGSPVKVGAVFNNVPPAVSDGQRVNLQATNTGALIIAGTALVPVRGLSNFGNALLRGNGTAAPTPTMPLDFNGTTWDPKVKPNLTSRITSAAASTNATLVKASAGEVFRISGYSANAAARYLKLYNKAGAPTVGTDTPVWTEYLPAQSKFELPFPAGFYFSTGIALALTTGVADSDTGSLTSADVLGLNVAYA